MSSSTVIGQGVIEVVADARKLTAGIEDAKRTVSSLGAAARDTSDSASKSIDRYVQRLQLQTASLGASRREAELLKLTMRGASESQLKAADNALRLSEAYERQQAQLQKFKVGVGAVATIAVTASIALAVAGQKALESVANYQGLAEKIGDTAERVATLKLASDTSGVSLDKMADASVKLTDALSKTDDEGKSAGAAIKALGLDFDGFKALSPVQQLDAVAKAMSGFADGSGKTAVAVALFGRAGAELIPLLNDIADGGARQVKLTQEQIRAADDYTKAQARLKSEFSSFLEQQAAQLVPTLQQVVDLFNETTDSSDRFSQVGEFLAVWGGSVKTVFQTIAVVASDVSFVFRTLWKEVEATGQQLLALARLDFKKFTAISDAVREDAERARAELDRFQAGVMNIGKSPYVDDEIRRLRARSSIAAQQAGKPNLDIAGLADGTQVKAQLDLQVAQIRAAGATLANALSNAEKVMEATRAAGLLDEKQYYEERRRYIELTTHAQEGALVRELEVLRQQKFAGKDKLDNDRKIADAQAKLDKLRADSATSLVILGAQERAALTSLQQYYRDATDAAQQYLDTLRKAQQQELAGLGAGNAERQRLSGRGQIEDKYNQQLRELDKSRRDSEFAGTFGPEARAKYEFELDLIRRFRTSALKEYDDYYKAVLAKQQDWTIGASEALANYADVASNIAAQTENLFTNAFQGMEDALVEFVKTGQLNFSALADSIISDLIRIQVQQNITGPLARALGGALFSGGGGGAGLVAVGGVHDSFAGGGYTGSGTRSGGLDGQGGFLAMLHPQETVVDHTRGGGSGGAVQVTYAPVYHVDSRSDRAQVVQDMERIARNHTTQLVDRLARLRRI